MGALVTRSGDLASGAATLGCLVEATLDKVRQLRGLLPICSYCKRIRNDQNYWERVEVYVSEHTDPKFTHGICRAVSRDRESRVRSRRGDYRDASRSAVGARASSVRRTSRASSDRLNGLARNASVSRDGISSRLTSAR